MNFRELQAFVHLAETLHFSRTAEHIHVSTSTLSRMMQRLEEEFGQSFFERDNRSVKLTMEGEQFVDFARDVINKWLQLKQKFQHDTQELTGELSIYCTVTAAHLYLTRLLESFRKLHPKVEIVLETGDVAAAYQKVERQEVDIAFAVAPDNLPKKFTFQSIESIPLKVIAPAFTTPFSNALLKKRIDWSAIPFVMPESGPAKKHTKDWMSKMGIKPKVYAQVAGHEAIVSMTALGCGVSIVPEPVLEHSPVKDKIKVLPVSQAPMAFDLGVVCLTKHFRDPAVQAFWHLVYQNFGKS